MLNKIKSCFVHYKYIFWIFILALILRIIALEHGFPFIFHPDEPSIVRSALGIRFDINPGHFDWPHLMFYLNYFIFEIFIKFRALLNVLGFAPEVGQTPPLLWRDPLVFYFISRLVDAILGALTVLPVYLSAKKLSGERAGLLAALLLSLTPFHVWTSHFALIDVPMLFFVSWGIYFSIRILLENKLRDYVLSGLMIGLAASTKYNGGLTAVMVPLAYILYTYYEDKQNFFKRAINASAIKKLIFSGVFAMLGFLVGTPFALFDFDTFTLTDSPNGALWQFANVGKVEFAVQLSQFANIFHQKLIHDFGYSAIILFIVYVFYGMIIWNRLDTHQKKTYVFITFPAIFLIFYISGFAKTRSHYYMMSYAYVIIGAAVFINKFLGKETKKLPISFGIKEIFLIGIISVPLFFSIKNNYVLWRDDTRVQLYEWLLEQSIDEDVTLVYDSNSLVPVMEKFSQSEVSKIQSAESEKWDGIEGETIFWITTPDTTGPSPKGFSKEAVFSPYLRRGPYIEVYEMKNAQE